MYEFTAFGFSIESEFFLPQLKQICIQNKPDIKIQKANLDGIFFPQDGTYIQKNDIRFKIDSLAKFRTTDGRLIEVEPFEGVDSRKLAIYILGSCMGAILHQRGAMILHGSSVTDGKYAVLLIGNSGAGKSTLASVFLNHGWKLMTDDVAVIKFTENKAVVQPSYPSQKLWDHSPEIGVYDKNTAHSLYEFEGKIKYGIDAGNRFCENQKPLAMIVRIVAGGDSCEVTDESTFACLDQLMGNTYRHYMILGEDIERHFQRCADIASEIPLVLAVRNPKEDCREQLYEKIIEKYRRIGADR